MVSKKERAKKPVEPPVEPQDLGLEKFQSPPDDTGLSLEELSETYASLLGGGADPYDVAPPPETATVGNGELPLDMVVDAAREEPDDEPVDEERPSDSCEISPRTILEAMLFVGHPAGEPLTSKHVASLMRGVRPREVDELVAELNQAYEAEECPYRIESVGAGYRLTLWDQLGSLRDRFYGRVKDAKLSQAAIDVLAVVAYNQPLTRPEIDRLRHASSGAVLSQLIRRGLIRVERPDRKPREPIFYTTDRFLEVFGLSSLDELPKSQDLDRAF